MTRSLEEAAGGCKPKLGRAALDFLELSGYTLIVRAAFKEWAVIVDALGRGDQIVILRKGGISEGRGGFQMEQPRFLLFPTLFHQQRESVVGPAQARYDLIAPDFPPRGRLRLEYFAEVVVAEQLHSLDDANALHGQHVWRDEVIAERFDWGREKAISALAVKVFRLPRVVELPMLPSYGGCKSWVELDREIAIDGARPVLPQSEFVSKLSHMRATLGGEFAPQMKG